MLDYQSKTKDTKDHWSLYFIAATSAEGLSWWVEHLDGQALCTLRLSIYFFAPFSIVAHWEYKVLKHSVVYQWRQKCID